jgi:ADP-heptose:LPS heptosyltransferase
LERVLVIKHGALGDFVLALGPAQAIRAAHPDARLTLLTSPAMAGLAQASGLFDEVWTDDRPGWRRPLALAGLLRRLSKAGFGRVYDLQTSGRSSLYFRLWPGRKPEWSGIAPGASHPHSNPARDLMHTVDRQREQLAMAGIDAVPASDLSFARSDLARLDLPARFALLVPGGSAHRPGKRWPVERWAALGPLLVARGLVPVLVGGEDEAPLAEIIRATCPEARDLTGATDLVELASLATRASLAIGNDTGPMHMAAAAGVPSVVLFGPESDPALCAPRGRAVEVIAVPALADLAPERVLAAADAVLAMVEPRRAGPVSAP